MLAYSNPSLASDPFTLPNVEVFQLTAREAVELDADLLDEYTHRYEYRLASMSSRVRDEMIDAIISDHAIDGGWYYWYCLPGCLPDSDAIGPYQSAQDALDAAQSDSY